MKKIIQAVQRFLLTVSLFLLYYGAIAAAALLLRLFRRDVFAKRRLSAGTFWKTAEGYRPDIASCVRQS